MFLRRNLHKAQSTIEVAILIAIVLSALLLLQGVIKRGFSGSLKEAADRMGAEPYSATGTTSKTIRTSNSDQDIYEEVNTSTTKAGNVGIDQFVPAGFGYTPKYVADIDTEDKYVSYTGRFGQDFTTQHEERMDSLNQEVFRWNDAPTKVNPDFTDLFPIK